MPDNPKRPSGSPSEKKIGVFFDEQIFVMQKAGGISRYVCSLAGGLAENGGAVVEVFGGISDNVHLRELRTGPGLAARFFHRRDRLRVNSLMTALSRRWRRRAFARFRKQFDRVVYHASYYDVDPVMNSLADATVVTFHDLIPEWLYSQQPNEKAGWLPAKKREAAAAADLIVAISEATRRDILETYPGLKLNIAVTLLASDLPLTVKQTLPSGLKGKRYFLMVGNRDGYKNGEYALKAFVRLAQTHPDVHLVAFGGGELSGHEAAILDGAGIRARFHHLTGPDDLLACCYANARGLLYPSEFEGFGLPVLEAMQLGCPVITTSCKSLPEVGGTAPIYVSPRNEEGLRMAMTVLLDHPEKALLFSKAGLLRAQEFSWEKTAAATLQAYQTALSLKSRHA